MRVTKKLLPGQPGTKKLVKKYGKDLVCVRYRYDPVKNKSIKTIELILNEAPQQQPVKKDISADQIKKIRIAFKEPELRKKVRTAGGKWNGKKQLWELPYREILKLGLTEKIVD